MQYDSINKGLEIKFSNQEIDRACHYDDLTVFIGKDSRTVSIIMYDSLFEIETYDKEYDNGLIKIFRINKESSVTVRIKHCDFDKQCFLDFSKNSTFQREVSNMLIFTNHVVNIDIDRVTIDFINAKGTHYE